MLVALGWERRMAESVHRAGVKAQNCTPVRSGCSSMHAPDACATASDPCHFMLPLAAGLPTVLRAQTAAYLQVGTVFQPLMTYEQPPTYFSTSKVTGCFQEIVDAYGMARYREANPMPFTVVTFPFLFAVMFGDIGHGILMLLFALWMVINERKMLRQQLNEILGMMFAGAQRSACRSGHVWSPC